jgi:hypothetical protein
MMKMNAANAIVNPVERNLEFVLRGCIVMVMVMVMKDRSERLKDLVFCVWAVCGSKSYF